MQIDTVRVGSILTDVMSRKSYRVILIEPDCIELCTLGITSLELFFISLNEIREKLISKEMIVEENENVVDIELMSEKEKEKFELNKEIINKINKEYAPTYEGLLGKKKKPVISDICQEYGVTKETIRRLYIKYIQAGCSDFGLLDNRHTSNRKQERKIYEYNKKTGKQAEDYPSLVVITPEVKEQFNEAINYFKSGKVKTYEAAYEWMCSKYYTQTTFLNGELVTSFLPMTEIPTKRQFTYYIRKNLNIEEIDQIKTSKREQRNDKRLLVSDALNNVLGPGDLAEIDAVEVDVSLVSEADRTKTVGRPIVYALIDVYTRMILAVSISFDNNSEIALTNCLLNLADDKVEFCKKFGITITEDMWVSNIIPRRIRCDRGADFKSKAFQRICANLGVDRQLVSAATGSLKGTVEQVFRQIHTAQNVHLENKGLIEKRYDSKHHKEAMLTITEYTRILLSYVITHNAKAIDKYPLTRDMIEKGVRNKPLDLWKYGCQKYGAPRPISNKNQFIYDLLIPCKVSLDRKGMKVNGLYYMNWDDEKLRSQMYEQQNKVMKLEARYDPRDVGQIYYLRDGKLQIAKLNKMITGNADYAGLSYKELKEYRDKKKKIQKETEIEKQTLKNNLFMINQNFVQEIDKKQTTYPSTKTLRENRTVEKQITSQKNNVMEHIEKENEKLSNESLTVKSIAEENGLKQTQMESFLDALDEFED